MDGYGAHEKMLTITNHERNENKNYSELSLHTGQNGHHHKNPLRINVGEGVERRKPFFTVGGNVN